MFPGLGVSVKVLTCRRNARNCTRSAAVRSAAAASCATDPWLSAALAMAVKTPTPSAACTTPRSCVQ